MAIELYNNLVSINNKSYHIRVIKYPEQDNKGKIKESSEFAREHNIAYRVEADKAIFFELDQKTSRFYDKIYIGAIFDKQEVGKLLDIIYRDPIIKSSDTFPAMFFLRRQSELIKRLAQVLPKAISAKIKDLYELSYEELDRRVNHPVYD